MNYLIWIAMLFLPMFVEAKIEMISPKNGDWSLAVDDLKELPVKGKVSDISVNSQVNVKIQEQVWSGKTDSHGNFSILVDPTKIIPYDQTEVQIVAIENNKEKFRETIYLYCCSTEKYGFYKELKGSSVNLVISNSGENLNGLEIKSIGNLLPSSKNLKVVVGIETYMNDIPKEKYTAVNSAVSIKFQPQPKENKFILYTFTVDLNTPRTRFGVKTNVKDWEYVNASKWADLNRDNSQVTVLGHDPYSESGSKWIELKPTKISGNKVQIKVPAKNNYDRFVPVLVLSKRK